MTTTADSAAAAAIELPMVRAEAARLAEDAKRSKLSYLGFLPELLETEVDARAERRRQRRITEAEFPRPERLVDFDLDAAPAVKPRHHRHPRRRRLHRCW